MILENSFIVLSNKGYIRFRFHSYVTLLLRCARMSNSVVVSSFP
jgi:hypothetical protein